MTLALWLDFADDERDKDARPSPLIFSANYSSRAISQTQKTQEPKAQAAQYKVRPHLFNRPSTLLDDWDWFIFKNQGPKVGTCQCIDLAITASARKSHWRRFL